MPALGSGPWWMGMHCINGTVIFPLIFAYVLYARLPGQPWLEGTIGCAATRHVGAGEPHGHAVYGAILGSITGTRGAGVVRHDQCPRAAEHTGSRPFHVCEINRAVTAVYAEDVRNRSVPAETVLPHVIYENVADALTWLNRAFGFIEDFRYGEPGGPVQGAQMHLGSAWIMLGSVRPGRASPAQFGFRTQSLTLFIDDVDAHFERAKSAGAKIVEELHETPYGERQYGAEDLEGHHWLFSKHIRDVSPAEWGATVPAP